MFKFNNSYINLPERFYSQTTPYRVSSPTLIGYNEALAQELGIDLSSQSESAIAEIFAGQVIPNGAQPIALAYSGHQFGQFSPRLGDGRALLLGEVLTKDNKRFDIQLKGSGRTEFSRRGDGKSSLGPVIREYIVSEAMHALGAPTTRALAAVETGDLVQRETQLLGGVFTRVAASHIRVGTFEYFSSQQDIEALKILADYTIDRHYPTVKDDKNKYLELIKCVAEAQSTMVAKWMSLGFIHGVMNTDNMSISGETLDYGPCAFMDNYKSDKVFSSIDVNGRYAYNNQINIAKWNLYRFASSIVPLIGNDPQKVVQELESSIESYLHIYEQKYLQEMRKKLGLFGEQDEDESLLQQWLQFLESEELDFTINFRKLSDETYNFVGNTNFENFVTRWQQRLDKQEESFSKSIELMNSVNPVFIPRNHHVQRAIDASLERDYSIFNEMNEVLKRPYQKNEKLIKYRDAPTPNQRVKKTFCGT